MTKMLKNSTATWKRIFSHMKNIESLLRSSMAHERIQLGPSEHWALSTKWTLQTLLIYLQLQKPGKDCFKRFVLRTCNFGFRSHLFLYQKFFCCQFNLEKILLFNFCDFCIFKSRIWMNTKLRFQVGRGPLISLVRQGSCGLNSALFGGILPKCRIPPIDLSSSLQWRPPLATFRLWIISYTKNIKQHHQMHSNWLEIEWVKNFSLFFVIHNNTIL